MSKTLANGLLLFAGMIWGLGFVAQQTAMDDIGPILFVAIRFLMAGFVVLPFAIFELRKAGRMSFPKEVRANWFWFVFVGSAFFMGMVLQQISLLYTTVTNAGFLTALYVVIVPFIMIFILRKTQPLIIWPAAFLALLGIYLLSGGDLSQLNWGDILVIICAGFWGIHMVTVGHVARKTGIPVTMAVAQFFVTSILAFIAWAGFTQFDSIEFVPTGAQLLAALPELSYAAVFAGGLAFTLQAIGQKYTTEAVSAVLLSTESLFAAIFGAIFLGERLGAIGYVGCALIFAAILIVELIPSKSAKQPAQA